MDEISKTYRDDIKQVAESKLPWHLLEGNILVTGATGLIGSCLVEVLMSIPNSNFVVYAAGRNESRAKILFNSYWESPRFHFITYDVTLPLQFNISFSYIIHAASGAYPKAYAEQPVEVMTANFIGVKNLLDYGKQHNTKRLLYISSGEIYGEGDGSVFSEDYSGFVDCASPRACYPSSKRAAETLCVSYAKEYGVDVVIARPCHIYGPHFTENDNRVYAQFIRNVLRGEDIVMKSTGEQFRSWCYVVDCVSALLHILLIGKNGNAYNIADEASNISIRELANMIASIGGRKVIMDEPSDQEKAGYNVVHKSIFNTDKIKSLGWNVVGQMKNKMENTILFKQEEIKN